MDENRVTYFAETDARNRRVAFGIKSKDRTRHVYVIGKTGMGKSTLLENMAIQDIKNGEGLAFIDPHGKTAELLLDFIPEHRIKDVLYFAPFDMGYPISFNVMEDVGVERRHLVASGLMSSFKKIWIDAWSARMEYILNNTILALLEFPGSTLLGINRMLADKEYRKEVVENIKDVSVRAFWVDEFAKYGDRYMQEAGAAIQNKVGQFISNPLIRNIIGQPHSTFDLRKMMDDRKIIIMNLSKGRVGEINANLLGSMLVTKIYLAAMSRADINEATLKRLPAFNLYVDEFQSFANESFADILSEARKYKLNLTVAHQYIEQMSEEVRAAVFGNIGTMVCFRVGAYDAEVLEKEFAPEFTAEDMVNLGFAQVYLKLMIDGVTSPPFSSTTLPPFEVPKSSFRDSIIANSRTNFARPRADVEQKIVEWSQAFRPLPVLRGAAVRRSGGQERIVREDKITRPPALDVEKQASRVFEPKAPERHEKSEVKPAAPSRAWQESSTHKPMPLESLSRPRERSGVGSSEKNRAELRSALASIIGKNSPSGENRGRPNSEVKPMQLDKKINLGKNYSSARHVVGAEEKEKGGNGVRREDKRQGNASPSSGGGSPNEKPREVPAEVLRKILSMEDEEM